MIDFIKMLPFTRVGQGIYFCLSYCPVPVGLLVISVFLQILPLSLHIQMNEVRSLPGAYPSTQ